MELSCFSVLFFVVDVFVVCCETGRFARVLSACNKRTTLRRDAHSLDEFVFQ